MGKQEGIFLLSSSEIRVDGAAISLMPVKKPEPKDYQRRMFYVVVDCVDPKDDYIEEVETVGPFVASVLVKARIS